VIRLGKRLLTNPHSYLALQKLLGADRLRYQCLSQLDARPGETVLDIGCGPAYYLDRLPGVRYFGFDTEPRYIDYARRRWGSSAEFHCTIFNEEHLSELPRMDKVLLLGLLHHLSDDESRDLLNLVARILTPDGVVISVDTCRVPNEDRVSRWMAENDRGEHVRYPEEFEKLAAGAFDDVGGEVWSGVARLPSNFWMMRMAAPQLSVVG
jgi:SAM-dependent methyltransferase